MYHSWHADEERRKEKELIIDSHTLKLTCFVVVIVQERSCDGDDERKPTTTMHLQKEKQVLKSCCCFLQGYRETIPLPARQSVVKMRWRQDDYWLDQVRFLLQYGSAHSLLGVVVYVCFHLWGLHEKKLRMRKRLFPSHFDIFTRLLLFSGGKVVS